MTTAPLLPPAAATARLALEARIAAADVTRLRHILLRELPIRLGLPAERVAVAIVAGSDPVGVAVLRRDGSLVAVAGSKADALADPPGWLTARVQEIEAAP
jgi:hypothetical protein